MASPVKKENCGLKAMNLDGGLRVFHCFTVSHWMMIGSDFLREHAISHEIVKPCALDLRNFKATANFLLAMEITYPTHYVL